MSLELEVGSAKRRELWSGTFRSPGTRATARHVVAGDQKIGVVELELPSNGAPPKRVDIYEAYWAPLTEGEVTLRDVVSFLFRTGITSVPRSLFPRWMFG
jgi:hypothetical protein